MYLKVEMNNIFSFSCFFLNLCLFLSVAIHGPSRILYVSIINLLISINIKISSGYFMVALEAKECYHSLNLLFKQVIKMCFNSICTCKHGSSI